MSETTAVRGRFRRDLVSKAWREIAGERRVFFGLAGLSMVTAQAESVALVLIALVADSVARGTTTTQLTFGSVDLSFTVQSGLVLTAAAIILAALTVVAYGRLWAGTYARLERDSRDEIIASFAAADWEYQSMQRSSRLQGRLLRLMDARALTFGGLVGWIRAVATIAVFVTVAALMSPLTAVVIVTFAAALSLAILPLRRRTVRLARRAAEEEVGLATDVAEAADHGADVHVFGAWPDFLSRFAAKSLSLYHIRKWLGTLKQYMPVVYQYGAFMLILLVILVGYTTRVAGQFGQFAATALLLLRSVQYGQQLQGSLQQIAESIPRIELLRRELVTPPPRFRPGSRILKSIKRVELRRIGYHYPTSATAAVRSVSLDLQPGTIVGIAGPSGSGKSTLAQILLRLRWPSHGQYLVNGRTVDEYSADSWLRVVSHVPQQPHLLHASLAENVSFLDDTISRDRVQSALQAVGLDGLTESLTDGLDTKLGPTGHGLSGGQIQRLGIARALAREPCLVILDEPTSALDVDAEHIVGDALAALRSRPDVLVVVIAHRASTLALCDEIVVLQDGKLVASGKSDQVASHSSFMARTWGQ